MPGRWPRLFQLVSEHKSIFLTWTTVLPAVLAFLLFALNLAASQLVWPPEQPWPPRPSGRG